MLHLLSYSPGQKCTLFLETKNSDGYLADGYYEDGYNIDGYDSPIVQKIYLPDLSSDGYFLPDGYMPKPMIKLETGIYCYSFYLPTGASSVGSYLAKIIFRNPDTLNLEFMLYQITVNAPYGLYSVRTS